MKLFKAPNKALARTLETERLILRPLGYFEAARVMGPWRKDPEIMTAFYQSPRAPSLRKWLRSKLLPNNKDRFAFAIIPKETGQIVGVNILNLMGYRSVFSTIALHDRNWRGRGVVLEARAKLVNHFFANGEIERFFGTIESRNLPSVYNYKRLGYDHVGTWHRHVQNPQTGEVYDLLHFELFREKWQAGPFAEHADER